MTWTANMTAAIEAMKGRTRQTLYDLAGAVPEGADVFPAWNRIEQLLQLRDRLDPVLAARSAVSGIDQAHAGALATVVGALADSLDRALDQGLNETDDPIYRPARLPLVKCTAGSLAGWRLLHIAGFCGEWPNTLPGLPEGHPLRTITPIRGMHGPALVVDMPECGETRYIRRSTIAQRTAQIVAVQADEDRTAQRRRDATRVAAEAEAARLERMAKELRVGV